MTKKSTIAMNGAAPARALSLSELPSNPLAIVREESERKESAR